MADAMLTPGDVLKLVEKTPDHPRCDYAVEPAVMYKAIVPHILAGLESGQWTEADRRGGYIAAAAAVPKEGWALIFEPLTQETTARRRQMRATALGVARRWFVELLHQAIGGDRTHLAVQIRHDPDYRSR